MSGIKDALGVVISRLQTIQIANGYISDAGLRVSANIDSNDVEKMPAITVFSGEGELLSKTRTSLRFSREIIIEGYYEVCPDDTVLDAEDHLLDLHRALFAPECNCGSATEYLDNNVSKIDLSTYSITERKDSCRVQAIAMMLKVEYIVSCCEHQLL